MRHPVPDLSSDALRELFWREEIPKAMCWLEGEGHAQAFDPGELARVFPPEPAFSPAYVDDLVPAGLVRRTGAGLYELTNHGRTQGARVLADEFQAFDEPAPADPAVLCEEGCEHL